MDATGQSETGHYHTHCIALHSIFPTSILLSLSLSLSLSSLLNRAYCHRPLPFPHPCWQRATPTGGSSHFPLRRRFTHPLTSLYLWQAAALMLSLSLSLHRSTLGLAQRQQQQQKQRQTGEANNVCASRSEDLQRGGRSASFLLPPSSSILLLPPSSSLFLLPHPSSSSLIPLPPPSSLLPPPIAPEDRSRTSVAADDV